jgi:hypothetical protein
MFTKYGYSIIKINGRVIIHMIPHAWYSLQPVQLYDWMRKQYAKAYRRVNIHVFWISALNWAEW